MAMPRIVIAYKGIHQILLETTWHSNKYATKEQRGNDDVKNIKHHALLIIIKDLKMASLNELFILLSSSLHLSTGWLSPPLPPVFVPIVF